MNMSIELGVFLPLLACFLPLTAVNIVVHKFRYEVYSILFFVSVLDVLINVNLLTLFSKDLRICQVQCDVQFDLSPGKPISYPYISLIYLSISLAGYMHSMIVLDDFILRML